MRKADKLVYFEYDDEIVPVDMSVHRLALLIAKSGPITTAVMDNGLQVKDNRTRKGDVMRLMADYINQLSTLESSNVCVILADLRSVSGLPETGEYKERYRQVNLKFPGGYSLPIRIEDYENILTSKTGSSMDLLDKKHHIMLSDADYNSACVHLNDTDIMKLNVNGDQRWRVREITMFTMDAAKSACITGDEAVRLCGSLDELGIEYTLWHSEYRKSWFINTKRLDLAAMENGLGRLDSFNGGDYNYPIFILQDGERIISDNVPSIKADELRRFINRAKNHSRIMPDDIIKFCREPDLDLDRKYGESEGRIGIFTDISTGGTYSSKIWDSSEKIQEMFRRHNIRLISTSVNEFVNPHVVDWEFTVAVNRLQGKTPISNKLTLIMKDNQHIYVSPEEYENAKPEDIDPDPKLFPMETPSSEHVYVPTSQIMMFEINTYRSSALREDGTMSGDDYNDVLLEKFARRNCKDWLEIDLRPHGGALLIINPRMVDMERTGVPFIKPGQEKGVRFHVLHLRSPRAAVTRKCGHLISDEIFQKLKSDYKEWEKNYADN